MCCTCSTAKSWFCNALYAEAVNCEKTAAQLAVAWETGQWRLGHRRHKENIQIGSTKHRAGDFLDWHVNDALDIAIGRVAHKPAVIDQSVPYATF